MRKLTDEEFKNKMAKLHNGDIVSLEQYVNQRSKIIFRCNRCEYVWSTVTANVLGGHGCPKCAGKVGKTTASFKAEVFRLVGNEYSVLSEYKNNKTKIKFKHNVDGFEFMMTPHAFLSGQRSPNKRYLTTAKKNTIPLDKINNEMLITTKGKYKIVGDFTATSHTASIKCNNCGKIFRNKPTRIIRGGIGCPNCYKSKGEDVVEEYLIKNNYSYKKQYKFKDCKNKRSLPFDFAVFEENNLIFLIEYDGIQHFKPKFGMNSFKSLQITDGIKNKYCKEKNIKLIRIKYNRSENINIFKAKITKQLTSKINMEIPSQA